MTKKEKTVTTIKPMLTAKQVRQRNAELGGFYFSPDTMRYFNSILYDLIYHLDETGTTGFIIVSNKKDDEGPREFNVVHFFPTVRPDGIEWLDLRTRGSYATLEEATRAAEKITDRHPETGECDRCGHWGGDHVWYCNNRQAN